MKFLNFSLLIEIYDMSTCKNSSVKMAITPLINETVGDSMGMAASSAIINITTI